MLSYSDFIEKVNSLGFMSANVETRLGDTLMGFPSVGDFICEEQLWTGDPDTDPWLWKDRVTEEKKLAFGSFFGGKKGYISPGFFPVFMAAFHPEMPMKERWEAGKLGRYEWDLWNLLRTEKGALGVHEIRQKLGVTPKNGANSLDTATVNLQIIFDISAAGNKDMLDKHGRPYNKAVKYTLTENWAPAEWLARTPSLKQEEALEMIYRRTVELSEDMDMEREKKIYRKALNLYKKYAV